MKMYLVNLTPHDVNICDKNGRITKIYRASGKVARVNNGYETVDYINDVPLRYIAPISHLLLCLTRPHS